MSTGMSRPIRSHHSVPRTALTRREAAESLGVGLTTLKEQMQPDLRIVRRGKFRLIPVAELERWLEENAERADDAWNMANQREGEAASRERRQPRLLNRITPHGGRHTCASLFIAAGVNAEALRPLWATRTSRSPSIATGT
jgi:integrase